ncbi:Phosphatidylinositol-3,4,5-trisphosphate-dependent Rac exchanger 1 protein [Balamuthia mandrillaris]
MFWTLFGVVQLLAWLVVASQLINISKSVAELEVKHNELVARLVGRRHRKRSDRPDQVASSASSSTASLEEALQSVKGGSGVQQEPAADCNGSPNVLVAEVKGNEAKEAAREIERVAEEEVEEEEEEESIIEEDTEAEIINAEDDEEEDEEAAEFEEQKEEGEEEQPPTQQLPKGPDAHRAMHYSPPTKRGDEASIPEARARAGSFPYKVESSNNNQLSSIVSSLSSSVAAVLPSFLSSASASAASQERRRRAAPRKLSSSWYSRLNVPLPNVLRSDKRWRALCELFRVEKYQAKAMRLLCEQIRTPLAELVGTKEEILTNEDIALIFGNVEALMSHERSLLTALQQRLTVDWPKQHASERALADLFDVGEYLKEYKKYVSNHPSAAIHLEHCLNNRPRLVPFLLSKVSLPEMSHGLFLEDLLRVPIQRPPCALFLLTKVKNDTPEPPSSSSSAASSPSSPSSSSSERYALEQVLSAYASALKELASVCPTIGDTEQVLRIQQRIDCEKLGQLVLPWRWYVGGSKAHELKIEKFVGLMRSRLFFLFSDVLLVVKRRKHNAKKLEWRHTIPLINLRVESLPGKHEFRLVVKEVRIKVTAANEQAKRRWVSLLKELSRKERKRHAAYRRRLLMHRYQQQKEGQASSYASSTKVKRVKQDEATAEGGEGGGAEEEGEKETEEGRPGRSDDSGRLQRRRSVSLEGRGIRRRQRRSNSLKEREEEAAAEGMEETEREKGRRIAGEEQQQPGKREANAEEEEEEEQLSPLRSVSASSSSVSTNAAEKMWKRYRRENLKKGRSAWLQTALNSDSGTLAVPLTTATTTATPSSSTSSSSALNKDLL